jgi:hypothetical protein
VGITKDVPQFQSVINSWSLMSEFQSEADRIYTVELQASVGASAHTGLANSMSASALVDAMFTIDPTFVNATEYSLEFSPGIADGDPAGARGPIAGAGLPGLVFGSGGLLAWRRRNRKAIAAT